jgi:alpha-tubulin suppressor-like RCC1 family protein
MKRFHQSAAIIVLIVAGAFLLGCPNPMHTAKITTHKVLYDANGGIATSVPVDAKSYNEGEKVIVLDVNGKFVKDEYGFGSWNTKADGSGMDYHPGDSFVMGTNDVTLYAQGDIPIKCVSTGSSHTMILKEDGSLWAAGLNQNGQLGDGSQIESHTFKKVMEGVKTVAAGGFYTMVVKNDGSVWATGNNCFGQLGIGDIFDRYAFVPVQGVQNVRTLVAGSSSAWVIEEDGSLWGTGYNCNGQMGDGTTNDFHTFKKIMDNVQSVASGGSDVVILKTDGSVWAAGSNHEGELGDGTSTDSHTFKKIINGGVLAISSGTNHTMVVKTDGSLWATGYNCWGQLGLGVGDTTTRYSFEQVKAMADVHSVLASSYYTMILKNDGSLFATGRNYEGQLGDGSGTQRESPVPVTDGVQAVSTGTFFTMILKSDGSLWATGRNRYGQFGNGSTSEFQLEPIEIRF